MIELALNKIEKYYGANKVLEDVTLEVKTRDRLAIIGSNGTGKTTIFKIISGIEEYNGGVMSIRKGATIGYLDQIPEYPEHYKVIDILNLAFQEQFKIKNEMLNLETKMSTANQEDLDRIMKKYGKLQTLFEHLEGYDIEEKVSKICTGLKITDEFKNMYFSNLSGGEKTTVLVGKILLQNPDILLLDEPSNHLDIESVEWLEGYLNDYKGTILIISHDRYFLDRVVNRTAEIEAGTTDMYEGNYSYYFEEKRRRIEAQLQEYENQQKKIKSMEDAIKRFRHWGTIADNGKMFVKARNMQRRIDKMEKLDKPTTEKKAIQLDFDVNDRSGKDVLMLSKIYKSFDDKVLLENIDLHVRYGEKVVILGKNGCGKSTLIKILLSQYEPDKGEVTLGSSLKIGYLDQEVKFEIPEETVLDTFKKSFIMSENRARGILAKFLFYGEDVFKKVSSLSGGERSRLRLCQLMHQDVNLLIFDEPTNHLDIGSREMLEASLLNFEGTIVFVSHDRYFVNKIAERVAEIRDKKIKNYEGNYDYYREKRLGEALKEDKQAKVIVKSKKEIKKKPSVNKGLIEKKIIDLENEIAGVEEILKQTELKMDKYKSKPEKLNELFQQSSQLKQKHDALLDSWMELSSKL
ncbi:ABC-F type ribosomal protection protein [Herbivorax sp. ANBcel31]|uniref:ribosomal protection-like ABC-F family protein n=1 Tax=Herbivorax sp. ANBcel31 TaxID=3069754 RepID=UPI0027B30731|nr:ABC-F type ribosomal protection protein [Herbivorax sp. ANBcel31]MDQ2088016.1 ABC-F type ribosomal protection protein [Herbivorax sp. ANBcel31]